MTTREEKKKINEELNKYFIKDLSYLILDYIPFFFGECIKTLAGHENSIYSLAVLPDGRLYSGDQMGSIKIWK